MLATMVVLSGCGSDAERHVPPPPRLPFEVANELAADSDKIAVLLTAGEACAALDEVHRLREDAIKAINQGMVPVAFQEHLSAAVNDLSSRISCVPPRDEFEEDEDKKEDKDKKGKEGDNGKGKNGGKGHG